ncbi:hypothetical protein [Streptomyces sp. NPDC006855]|uniref:hypothetical protein n=1 Tax=Streptomyces sp. NPDC006855 TaxID=3364765 RepID=UPI003673B56F
MLGGVRGTSLLYGVTAVRCHCRTESWARGSPAPRAGRFLPEGAQFALLGGASGFPDALAAPYGLLLLVGRTAAMSLAGTRLFTRRDV